MVDPFTAQIFASFQMILIVGLIFSLFQMFMSAGGSALRAAPAMAGNADMSGISRAATDLAQRRSALKGLDAAERADAEAINRDDVPLKKDLVALVRGTPQQKEQALKDVPGKLIDIQRRIQDLVQKVTSERKIEQGMQVTEQEIQLDAAENKEIQALTEVFNGLVKEFNALSTTTDIAQKNALTQSLANKLRALDEQSRELSRTEQVESKAA